jgi:hypothetical protein
MIPSPAIYNFRRSQLERWIDDTISLLDRFDLDPDIEEEPELGGDLDALGLTVEGPQA